LVLPERPDAARAAAHERTLQHEVAEREETLRLLAARAAAAEAEHAQWVARHQASAEDERRAHAALQRREQAHVGRLRELEEEIVRQRLAQLAATERAAEGEVRGADGGVLCVLCVWCVW